MLKMLRNKKTAKKIWIALGIIILPAFIFWGFSGAISDRKNQATLGVIAGKKISAEEFQNSLRAVKNRALIQYGDKLPEIEKDLDLEAQALQRIILLWEARKMKIKASDQEVINLIRAYPFFEHNGVFNERLYNEILKRFFKTPPREFEEEVRQGIIISKLYRKITQEVTLSEEELKNGYLEEKSAQDKKFRFNEKKFHAEKEEFRARLLRDKKQEAFLEYIAKILK